MGSPTTQVADHFCVIHIPAAIIPNSRLSDILARMHRGRPLTKYSRDFSLGFHNLELMNVMSQMVGVLVCRLKPRRLVFTVFCIAPGTHTVSTLGFGGIKTPVRAVDQMLRARVAIT